ncbi:MAG: hypothetical protein LBG89_00950 [Rickettsiales bacterium]|jgi:orotate phosphoribosyltransferase|nr:hypothetical protein [Rickettsiales bacterium]
MEKMSYREIETKKEFFTRGLLAKDLLKIAPGADEAAWFKLKTPNPDGSPNMSPLFWNLQFAQSYPRIFKNMIDLMVDALQESGIKFDHILGVPEGGKSIAAAIGLTIGAPILTLRKEAKDHGQGGLLIGDWKPGDRVLVAEDVATSGSSIHKDAAVKLRDLGMVVDYAIVGLDRLSGAAKYLGTAGIRLVSAMDVSEAVKFVPRDHPMYSVITEYVERTIVR